MRDLIEHWELVLFIIGLLASFVIVLIKLGLWFLRKFLDSFNESILRLEHTQTMFCTELKTIVEKFTMFQLQFAELRTEHDLMQKTPSRKKKCTG